MMMTLDFADDPPACTCCGKPPTMTDALGIMWCEDCEQRGRLINWGAAHNWRSLTIEPYAIGEGAYCWCIAIVLGCDDMIWLMDGLTEMLDADETREIA